MIKFNCIHSPGGAVVLLIVLGGAGSMAQMSLTAGLVALNVFSLLLFTWLITT
jgi:CBS-domain-containing membrane protein